MATAASRGILERSGERVIPYLSIAPKVSRQIKLPIETYGFDAIRRIIVNEIGNLLWRDS